MAIVEAVFFGGVGGGVGVLLLFVAARHIRRRRDIAHWPRVEGTVVRHDMLSRRNHYRPLLEMRYRVDTRTLVHVVDSPTGSGYPHSAAAERELAMFPVGSTVTLYVHPTEGTPAYRELPEWTTVVLLTLGGLLFLGIALVAIGAAL